MDISKMSNEELMALDAMTKNASLAKRGMYSESVMGRKIVPLEDRANTPEVGAMTPPSAGSVLKYGAARAFKGDDDETVANVLLKAIPEAELLYDQDPKTGQETPYLSHNGKAYYINKPGMSGADAESFAGNVAAQIPAGAWAMRGKTLLSQGGRAAVGSGATSVAGDAIVNAIGGKNEIDMGKAGISAAAAPIAQVIGAKIFPLLNRRPLVNVFGNLTPEGSQAMRKAGLDPAMFTPEGLAKLNEAVRRMGDGFEGDAAQAVGTKVQGEQFGIRTTLGQQTGNNRQIALEQAMRNDARGESAGRIIRGVDEAQRGDVTTAAAREQARMSGKPAPTFESEYDAGASLTQKIRGKATELDNQIGAKYAEVEGKPLAFEGTAVKDLKAQVESALVAKNVTLKPDLTPSSIAALERVNAIKNAVNLSGQMVGMPAKWSKTIFEDVDFGDLATVRKQLTALRNGAKSAEDARGVKIAIQAFDEWIDGAVDKGLARGEKDAIQALKEARALRTKYGNQFEDRSWDGDAGRVMDRIVNTDVTPNEVANLLVGYGEAGEAPVVTRVAKRLEDIFGKGSPEWNEVRELAFMRMVNGPKGTPSGYQAIVSRFDKALDGKGQSYLQTLFSPAELQRMRQFRGALGRLVPPKTASNPSGSGYEIARMMEDFVGKLLGAKAVMSADPAAAAGALGIKGGKAVLNSQAAKKAAEGTKITPGRGYAAAPGVGAATGLEARRRAAETPPEQKQDKR